jgi:hypothetical protein|tara:strand:- start:1612 stop:2010 length:399 start_codon:yes stop_codon:yes gene_type:complete
VNIYPNKQINPEKETMANKRHIQVGGGTIVMDGDVADEILPQVKPKFNDVVEFDYGYTCSLVGFDLIDCDGDLTNASLDGHTVDVATWRCAKCHTMLGIHSHGYIIEVSVSTPQVFPDGVLMPRKGTTEYDI